jgi:drug/metabolite transporter (DMT)-like permease
MTQVSNLRGIGFMLLSGFAFVLNDSFMKLAMAGLPPYEVLLFRGLSGSFFAVILLALMGDLQHWRKAYDRHVMLRAGLEAVAILTYILALAHSPIGDVTAIFQTTPLLVILGMVFLHRERITPLRLILVGLGFCGALLVAQPGSGANSPFILLAFVTAIFAALRDLAARQISSAVPALLSTLVLILVVLLSALICGMLFEHWLVPSFSAIKLTFAAGLFMMLGHYFTLLAYRHASAQAVAPFYYSFLLFAVIFGFVLFKDVPNMLAVFGMFIIVATGLAITALENRDNRS